jgi:creatinine amidohydrolase
MAGRILRYEELTSPAVTALDKYKTAVFIPVSPIEGHGPHLPLGVDFFDALHFAEKAAEITVRKRPDFDALIYPGIPLGTQLYKQPGSVRIESGVLYDLVVNMGKSLSLWGFKYIFLLSGHGSPKDIVALEAACRKVSKWNNIRMHNLSGTLAVRFLKGEFIERISARLPRPLSDEEKLLLRKDIHGGWWETSMMLQLQPGLVKENYKSLADNEKTQIADGANPGYFGSPAKASPLFAEISMLVLMDEVGVIIEKSLAGHDVTRDTISPLYNKIILRPKFKKHLTMSILAIVTGLVVYWLIYRLLIR